MIIKVSDNGAINGKVAMKSHSETEHGENKSESDNTMMMEVIGAFNC